MRLHRVYHGWPALYQTFHLPDEDAAWYHAYAAAWEIGDAARVAALAAVSCPVEER